MIHYWFILVNTRKGWLHYMYLMSPHSLSLGAGQWQQKVVKQSN